MDNKQKVEIKKLEMKTKHYDKILEKVADICPSAIQNGKIDFERLKAELVDVIDNNTYETYDFRWVGKNESILEANKPINKTLRPCKEESKNWDTTQNLYIEGDNLEVLKLLEETYVKKIKMIYIDPPYNTGNDFVYHDNRTQSEEDLNQGIFLFDEEDNRLLTKSFVRNTESNGRFHSDWCSMMYPRLKLARDLLADDGVIFISIDDNEVANLKKICDEVFGEEKFVNTIIWQRHTGGGLSKKIITGHDYVLVYRMSDETILKAPFTLNVDIKEINGKLYYIDKNPIKKEFGNKRVIGEDRYLFYEDLDEKDKKKYDTEYYCKKLWKNNKHIIYPMRTAESKNMYSITGCESGKGIEDLIKLGFSKDVFAFPKPVELIKNLVFSIQNKSAIILDFFSGSSTTAHAVMKLNAEDGGNRKFIMVQLQEEIDQKNNKDAYDFCVENNFEPLITSIGKERIRRAGEKIVQETGKKDLDIGFRVLKVDESNMQDVYYRPIETK